MVDHNIWAQMYVHLPKFKRWCGGWKSVFGEPIYRGKFEDSQSSFLEEVEDDA